MHFRKQTTLMLMYSFKEKDSVPHRLSCLVVTVFCVVAKTYIGQLMRPTHLSMVSCHFIPRLLHHQHSEWQFPGIKTLGLSLSHALHCSELQHPSGTIFLEPPF